MTSAGNKFYLEFNALKFFYVCKCVVCCDLALYMSKLIIKQLYNRTKCFHYLGTDANNKPSDVNLAFEKLSEPAFEEL